MASENNKTVVMFDTENSIILGDYLDLLLNRTPDPEEAYDEPPQKGVYIECCHNRPTQSTVSKLGRYEHILYANSTQKLHKKPEEPPLFTYCGGIRLPHYHGTEKVDEGSGNIIISGKPGVGKSTLAFQFAAACASSLNEGIAVYFSLDVDEKQIVKSMKCPDGNLNINFLCSYSSIKNGKLLQYDSNSNEELEAAFRSSLYKDEQGKIVPQLILPKLSPRGISPDMSAKEDVVFLQRIKELHKLLRAISAYNTCERTKKESFRNPLVKLVVIDSLDIFGEQALTREEINRLFMLFKQYGLIGVFTTGSVSHESLTSEVGYKSAVTYQADVVIELKKEFYNNYTCSYFEIVKSRYIRNVLGHHPYKVENYQLPAEKNKLDIVNSNEFSIKNNDLIKKLVVLPSLHYRISASENSGFPVLQKQSKKEGKPKINTIFGIKKIIRIMPNHFKERRMDFPQIITISGSSGLYKSDIALNALLSGIVDHQENGLIVRLGDRDAFTVRGIRFEHKLLKRVWKNQKNNKDNEQQKQEKMQEQEPKQELEKQKKKKKCFHIKFYEKGKNIIHNDEPNKYTLKGWTLKKGKDAPQLLEVTFKNGALLPEEFVDEICKIINVYKIRRIVFTDLKYIGSSYPFLVNSDTSGNLFLSAFVHIMRNYGMHVIMSSSESSLEASDIELSKAGILADAILSCTSETEHGEYKSVYLMGEGLITSKKYNRAKFEIHSKKYTLSFYDDSDENANEIKSTVKLRPFRIQLQSAPSTPETGSEQ